MESVMFCTGLKLQAPNSNSRPSLFAHPSSQPHCHSTLAQRFNRSLSLPRNGVTTVAHSVRKSDRLSLEASPLRTPILRLRSVVRPLIVSCLGDNLSNGAGSSSSSSTGMKDAEKEGWDKRKAEAEEAGTAADNSDIDSWQWTLNWDFITPDIAVGSCPRSASDVERLIDEAGVTAIINLQSDLCFEALEIPYDSIRLRAMERGVRLERVPVRDFDHGDQALMLPEAVRTLNLLRALGHKVYVHCTAGINRATLTVVGYLTFVQGMNLDEAVTVVRTARKVAHPYIDCWTEVRRRILDGKDEQLTAVSKKIYEGRCVGGVHGNMQTDWAAAQQNVLAETFRRWLEVDMGLVQTEKEIVERQVRAQIQREASAIDCTVMPISNGSSFSYAQYVAEAERLREDEAEEEPVPVPDTRPLQDGGDSSNDSAPINDEWGKEPIGTAG
eukprot:TRINITY_DN551_c0_g1_i1.p1 TRINITY_DN551_c0_g1~~TRINITY_DN551_c0_g1_i1.p1  ORF type:complete len:442 (+),score=63.69 TRINITY_DN551_c0_g1_i1:94-1419(+)